MSKEIIHRLEQLSKDLDQKKIQDVGYKAFVKNTPIDTGNARRNTTKDGDDGIHANYRYANRLETGWSKQAKEGMVAPTIKEVQKYIQSVKK